MNVLDENIIAPERARLREWRIHFRYIGGEVGHLGMKDREEIIPLPHSIRQPIFFTRDQGFYSSILRHPGYCLVYLDVEADETADYVRQFLRDHLFRTRSQHMGKVVRVRHRGVSCWRMHARDEQIVNWRPNFFSAPAPSQSRSPRLPLHAICLITSRCHNGSWRFQPTASFLQLPSFHFCLFNFCPLPF